MPTWRRDNLEDALAKLQEILDDAWQAVQPIELDPEKEKEIKKQLARGNERRLQVGACRRRRHAAAAAGAAVVACIRPAVLLGL